MRYKIVVEKEKEEITIQFRKKKRHRKIIIAICVIVAAAGITAAAAGYRQYKESKTDDGSKDSTTATVDMDVGKTILSSDQKEILEDIKATYNEENQSEIEQEIEEEKESGDYTEDNMLIKYNLYGTNTQSLYVYFTTDEAASVSYTVHAEEDGIDDFSADAYQGEEYQTEHEFQVLGLIPDTENTITFTIKTKDGKTTEKETTYTMGSLLGNEDTTVDATEGTSSQKLADGLYVMMGNDSENLDFMYYYDNNGVLRGEVPIIGYRSHRLLFDDDGMYYSISQTKIARVNRLGQVTKVYDTGEYNLHHDYVFDDDGNILILASDTNSSSVEDMIILINKESGKVTKVLDLADLLGDYKKTCEDASDGDLDWMHINTLQWLGDGQIIISSRETSTIMKIDDLYDDPSIEYMIGSEEFWDGTGYESLLLTQNGDFTLQGGQHSVTYVEDDSLEDGQYYLYMFNNNIGFSESQPDFSWSSIGLTNDAGKGGDNSYYYRYLVDENKGTFQLEDSFAVPYSGYVSSAQDIGDNTVMDSGIAGVFGEYDSSHKLIKSFSLDIEKFIYRVYKYDFEGFYFS